MNADQIISNRAGSHGNYPDNAAIAQYIKDVIRTGPSYASMTPVQRESLDLIATKLARICAGDPNFVEHWIDINGYSQLVVMDLTKG